MIVCSGEVSDDWNRHEFDPSLVERKVVCEKCPRTEGTILEAIRLDEERRENYQKNRAQTQQAAWRAQLHALTDSIENHAEASMAIKGRLDGHRAWVKDMTSKEFVSLARRHGRAETSRDALYQLLHDDEAREPGKPFNALDRFKRIFPLR